MAIREEIIKELKEFEEKINTKMIDTFNLLNQMITSQSHLFQVLENIEKKSVELMQNIQEQLEEVRNQLNNNNKTEIRTTPMIIPQKVKLSRI